MNRPFLAGVTGKTGSGKSLLCRMLSESHGCPVIDADALGHEALRREGGIAHLVLARFGPAILGRDGEIDRAALGALVFAAPHALADLNGIVHPWIVRRIGERIAALPAAGPDGIILLDAALLPDWIEALRPDAVVLVRASLERRLERLEAKGVSRSEARRRVEAQERLFPDGASPGWIRVDNDGAPEDLRRAAEMVWDRLEALRRAHRRDEAR